MQIDESDEHKKNADLSMDESFEPDANVTVERDLHSRKQNVPSFSTEEGMQIDESDEHSQNVAVSIEDSFEPNSKITVEIVLLPQKHPASSRSIVFGILTVSPLPKYFFIETHSKSKRKSPLTLKC
jgi:hypothetical protein